MQPTTTATAAAPAQRFEALDGWRGLCACFVVLFHFHGHSPLYESPLIRNSYLFVDFFFVLSGFVIAWNYADRLADWKGVKRFLLLRLGRVYPLHFFMLLLFIAYETAKLVGGYPQSVDSTFSGTTHPFAVVTNLLLLQGLHVHDSLTWNGPSWSISAELWAYVVFALLSLWIGMRTWMIVLAAIAAPLLLMLWSTSGMDATFDYGLLRCVFGFALGVACCRIHGLAHPAARRPGEATMTILELGVLAAVVGFVGAAGTSPLSFMAPFVFAAAVLVFAVEGGVLSRVLRTAPFRWLGTLSYSIYLTHYLFVLLLPPVVKRIAGADLWTPMELADGQYVMAFGRNDAEGTLLYVALLACTIAFSAFTYRWVEVPGREWTRRWLGRERPRGASPAQAERREAA